MKKVFLLFAFTFVVVSNTFAIKPMDYVLIYKYTWYKSGKVIINYDKRFCQDSQKLRIEIIKQNQAGIYEDDKQSATICRFDKKLIYGLNTKEKTYTQGLVTERTTLKTDFDTTGWKNQLVKMGEGKVLGYDCSICTYKDKPNIKYWFSRDFELMLKTEQKIKDSKYIIEVVELHFEKQPDWLFEIPSDYKLVKEKDF
jgi:hypothetical protein